MKGVELIQPLNKKDVNNLVVTSLSAPVYILLLYLQNSKPIEHNACRIELVNLIQFILCLHYDGVICGSIAITNHCGKLTKFA